VKKLDLQGDRAGNPLFDAAIVLQPNTDTAPVRDQSLKITPYPAENRVSRFDMMLAAVEIDGTINIALEYSTHLFKPSSIERLLGHYKEMMQQVVEHKEMKIEDITISTHLQAAESKERHIDFEF
jgi:hypothetical protein